MDGIAVQRVDVLRFDAPIIEDDGFAHIPATLTRTGVFPYRNADGSIRMELRHPEDVMHPDSLATLKRKPVVVGHPSFGAVNKDNAKNVSVGFTGDDIEQKEDHVAGTVTLLDGHAIDLVTRKQNPMRELSAGYRALVTAESGTYKGVRYDSRQRQIRYNHVAMVDQGRMGASVKLMVDSATGVYIEDSLQATTEIEFKEDQTGGSKPMPLKIKQPEVKLKSLRLDSATITVGDDSEAAIQTLQQREDALVTYARETEQRYDKLEGERDTLQENYDKLKVRADELEARPAVEDIGILVAERTKLMQVADSVKVEVKDSDSNVDIKRKVVIKAQALKADALEGKSDEYVTARYDGLDLDLARQKGSMQNLADAGGVGPKTPTPATPKKSKRELYLDARYGGGAASTGEQATA